MSIDTTSTAGLRALLALPKVGPKRALALAANPEGLATFAREDLETAESQAAADLDNCADLGIELVGHFDPRFPAALRGIPSPPALLYVRGNVDALNHAPQAAVVGTRDPDKFGDSATAAVTKALADAGYGIVNGLAKGVDTRAHQTALETGVPTVAFLAGGLDRIYPRENARLASEIMAAGGALASEQPPGTDTAPYLLVARNRMQTGLAEVVVVAQSGVRSGTMHTVRFALDQGRPLWCPQPKARSPLNRGAEILLEHPANRLHEVLPAFEQASKLCARLDDRPAARALTRGALDEWAAGLHSSPALFDR